MWKILFIFVILFEWKSLCSVQDKPSFLVDYFNGRFVKDGRPFVYKSGSIHYFRMHQNSWPERLEQMVQMGLNTIQYYIPWNYHEVRKGQFTFGGNRNFSLFSEIAFKQYRMPTIIRIGPYICSEWENGGLPWFVTMDEKIKLRSSDPKFLQHVEDWFKVLLPLIKPFLYSNGGSVIMVQIENEYGLFNVCDKKYMRWLRDIVRQYLGNEVVLFTTDPLDVVKCGSVEDVLPTIDFGPQTQKDIEKKAFALQKYLPGGKGPLVNSEYYTGWFTAWGQRNQSVASDIEVADGIRTMLNINMSFNLYMAFGGTNYGYWNGYNEKPLITSYDYGAPIREDGSIRPLYNDIAKAINGRVDNYNAQTSLSYGSIRMLRVGSINGLMMRKLATEPCVNTTFEDCQHPYGFMFHYKTTRSQDEIEYNGYAYFMHKDGTVTFDQHSNKSIWNSNDILLMEQEGRINYPSTNTKKGLLKGPPVKSFTLNDDEIWDYATSQKQGPLMVESGSGFYMGKFHLKSKIGNTHIRMDNWGKGVLFVNGMNMGRYWNIGPQLSLFVDQNYLKADSENTIVLFELLDVNRDLTKSTVPLGDNLTFYSNPSGCEGDTCYIDSVAESIWNEQLRE